MANETLNTAMGSISGIVAFLGFCGAVWKYLKSKFEFEEKLAEFNTLRARLQLLRATTETTLRNQLLGPGKVERQDVREWLDAADVEISEEQSVEYLVKQKGILSLYYRTRIVKTRTAELNRTIVNGNIISQLPLFVDDDASLERFTEQKEKLKLELREVEGRLRTQLLVPGKIPGKIVTERVKLWRGKVEEITGQTATDIEKKFSNVPQEPEFPNLVKQKIREMEELRDEGARLLESLVGDDYSQTLGDDEKRIFGEWKDKLQAKHRDVKENLSTELRQNPEKIVAEQVEKWLQKVDVIIPAALDVHNQLSSRHPPYPASLVNRVKELILEMELCYEISTFGNGNMVLSLQLLIAVTNNFSEENILGRGGFATVYKGEFLDGTKIAVKRMKPDIVNERVLTEFKSEIAILSRVQHRNLVGLLGYCIDGNERLLVYEYMPQGTLSRCLFKWKEEGLKPLEWTSRLRIALDVARGVEYLHMFAQESYIHRDIKSPNILLGDDMRAKVADFGFVRRAADGSVSVETRAIGTFGYFAPEYFESGRATKKADVYSFGVVLMELITGRKAVGETIDEETFHLVTWFRKMLIQKDTFREAIDQSIDLNEDILASIWTVAELAGHCSAKERDQRPRMSHVVNVLSSLAECWKPPVLNSDATHVPDFGMSLPEALENWRVVEDESIADITDAYDPCFTNGVTHAAASVANLNEDQLVEMVARSDLKDVLKACGQDVAEGDSPTATGLYVKRKVQ